MASYDSDRFAAWYADLEARTLTTLTFPEVRRALEALSGVYVERRDRLGRGADLDTAGKRAAFTLFYGALHLATTWRIAEALELGASTPARIIDLGGGTGVVGIATALACARPAPIEVVDRSAWALSEARQNLAWFGLEGRTRTSDLLRHRLAPEGAWVTLGWAVNELDDHGRAALLATLDAATHAGAGVFVIEPIARRMSPWWDDWRAWFERRGGRADEWRVPAEWPERLRLLDKAAGMDHRELTARTLVVAPRAT